MKHYKVLLATIGIAAGLFVLFQDKVNALSNPSGRVFSFTVTCAVAGASGTGTPVRDALRTTYKTVRCANPSTTDSVYLGGSDVDALNGFPIGAITGMDYALSMDTASPAYCMSSTAATIAIKCIGGQ